jgi:hypothetical protein
LLITDGTLGPLVPPLIWPLRVFTVLRQSTRTTTATAAETTTTTTATTTTTTTTTPSDDNSNGDAERRRRTATATVTATTTIATATADSRQPTADSCDSGQRRRQQRRRQQRHVDRREQPPPPLPYSRLTRNEAETYRRLIPDERAVVNIGGGDGHAASSGTVRDEHYEIEQGPERAAEATRCIANGRDVTNPGHFDA